MSLTLLVPNSGAVDVGQVCARLRTNQPFSPEILSFCDSLSRSLFHDSEARRFPELQALAFWMRKSELARLKEQFDSLKTDCTALVPRGLVFHIPPSNVDTIFMYSWVMSVLAGNANIIRFSERAGEAAVTVCRVFGDVLSAQSSALQNSTAIIRYGRENETTAAISAKCDVRVIWGGDATVNLIRAIPRPPHATELTFPDRYSLAAINASAYLALNNQGKQDLARRFYNDTFWFDQMACSSPHTVVWIGSQEDGDVAARDFYHWLDQDVRSHGYQLPAGARLNKLTFAYRAILDQPSVERVENIGSEITVLRLADLENVRREHSGGGLLFHAWTPQLTDLATILVRRDQTVTHFGFGPQELRELISRSEGRGGDRFVPVGQALTFNRYWDGYDLLREFTRTVYLQV